MNNSEFQYFLRYIESTFLRIVNSNKSLHNDVGHLCARGRDTMPTQRSRHRKRMTGS